MTNEKEVVARLWEYCDALRNVGISYGSYVEQLTFLLFLKMADEREKKLGQPSRIPPEYNWDSLKRLQGSLLEEHYSATLKRLGQESGLLGIIFRRAENKIHDPAQLTGLIMNLIDKQTWIALDIDMLGAAYEGLLQKNADDAKSGAGQYFTPRPLIKAIVEVMRPQPGQRICDPACGTGGFLLAAYEYLTNEKHYNLDRFEKEHLRDYTFYGQEIVAETARLCAMNLFLHGIGGNKDAPVPITIGDSLRKAPSDHFDIVLSNPPFGKQGEKGGGTPINRSDFWTTTSNKQLNFLQHIVSLLEIDGKAAVILPDNVLFEAGAGTKIRQRLLHTCNVHTLLRLPTGIFYKQGVKANVLFFDKKRARLDNAPQTKELWIYDLRTNKNFTLRESPLQYADLADFISCFHAEDRQERVETERFHRFTYEELSKSDKLNLDLTWLRDESVEDVEDLPPPRVLAKKMFDDLSSALEQLRTLAEELGADLEEMEEERPE